ncbi:hypothetical protein Mpop_2728 [Methylorubrum populi BJ001]|jgi:hypothetical protein|uniref:Uncharacterized protein n=1 Tax=Methylorubrum populi (strain ATCC BAA-705 / NCIMB 13946 / BJ001) TaxID=441620 RepID=B1ZD14_METPB|nr:hypothetical protein [Methylorubrum populi]ACB80883.1 hypothetical protein Mpop_2728 [Methylorubrum populi BJ001]
MRSEAPSITPARDAAESAIEAMKARMAVKPTASEIDALGIKLQIDLTSTLVRYLGDMSDRSAETTGVFSMIEAALAGGISSVLLSFTGGDRSRSLDLLVPLIEDLSTMSAKRIGATDDWEVRRSAKPQSSGGRA